MCIRDRLKKAQVKLDQLKGAVIEQGNALTRIKEIKQQVEKKAAKQGDTCLLYTSIRIGLLAGKFCWSNHAASALE